jgi:hypothetical protein
MPSEALSLALAASIYPPALAVVIALGRGVDVRLRVVLLVVAAYFTVFVTGTLILLLFTELGATSSDVRTPSAALYVLGGVLLVWLAARLHRPRAPQLPSAAATPSRTERYLGSRRLVLALGVVLYVIPSPIYLGALKAIADTKASSATQLSYLVLTLLVMLWIIELPALLVIAFPVRGVRLLESINGWFARHGRALAATAALVAGVYLIVVGLVEALG